MTTTEKLQTLREMRGWYADDDPPAKEAIDYGIQCVEAVQSRRTLAPSDITDPGLYLAKTTTGDVIALRVMAHEIEKGTVFLGLLYQGPLVWEGEAE
jgi:hypothetical protein